MTPDDVIKELRAPDQRSCGRMAGGMGATATDRLAKLDAASEAIRAWSPLLIPGLLQTPPYALAAIRSRTPSLPDEEAGARLKVRHRRSTAFLRKMRRPDGDEQAWIVMGEAALLQSVTTPPFHANQLQHLLDIVDHHPRICLRVLPDDVSTAGNMEPFTVHALRSGPRVGHLETIVGGFYTTRSEDITRLYSAFGLLSRSAMEPTETRRVIAACLQQCRTVVGEASTSPSRRTPIPTIAYTSPGSPPPRP
ncbi:DUF5753 domain-containing protein [Streptomyces sp. CoH27]|uniref:DUF5753 domain-containing protein n=1 Tax=Streptomyces sp. CoH27 TaxID=2875763 RepID=UPI001CD332B8|nr:DUF5753 domain-containing protein [Streptomyces sp. CoH27]